jgi:hypothetical protein
MCIHKNIICRQNGKSQHNNVLQTSTGSKIRKVEITACTIFNLAHHLKNGKYFITADKP